MSGAIANYPEVVLLRRHDRTGYGFFFQGESDFRHAAESFVQPIVRSFAGQPVPGQPTPADHLKTALCTFLGQAFDKAIPDEVGAEGISRAAAASVRGAFAGAVPRVVLVEQRDGRLAVRPAIEFMRHPGYPQAIVVDADTHGGEATFFANEADYEKTGTSPPTPRCWLPQIVYRLYARTPSIMVGRPLVDQGTGTHSVAFRAMSFGLTAPLTERSPHPALSP
jgi:hypothetical protein